MDLSTFDFNLPENLIAQNPRKDRNASKMLVVHKSTGQLAHKRFTDLINYLEKGDCLVLNNTKVLPARLYGRKEDTGANIEILLLRELQKDRWEALAKPARKVPVGATISFGNGLLVAKCVEIGNQGIRVFDLNYEGIIYNVLDQLGEMPLPPYIKKKLKDKDRYQTIYAKKEGSAAAPTAGLHFTQEQLEKIKDKGVKIVYLTLHVGLGTFRPVTAEKVEDHKMHAEYYEISKETAQILNAVKDKGNRIFAVGTTVTRTLETNIKSHGCFKEDRGWTDIFIYPPFSFQAIDGLITNFHLPKSTLLMLVSAFSSKELIFKAYEEAIQNDYRFFSFGDSMLILP